ncbi:MAG: ATP-binding cassette domain-containing protein, partial [Verrucomicrobiota bacterium]|nr:ATP-binding cassette domain-containing protein [Verrucomicrobiota bacterium]
MIEVSQLHKSFGQQQVLRGVNLQIDEGESVVIIGGSGCGKSVLLRHIIGLVQPDEGDVKIDGQSIADLSERELIKVRRKFGMLFQGAALFDSLTVEENVGFLLDREQTMSSAEIRGTVADALELVDLGGTQSKKPAELSGGMKKRVGLARAIVYKPEIILYDEPTTGLDPVVADSIDQLVIRMRDQLKSTSIVVTHDTRSMR